LKNYPSTVELLCFTQPFYSYKFMF